MKTAPPSRPSRSLPICIYCGSRPGSTTDHVPPKGWFRDVERPNLVRVPCCRTCNQEQNAAEEEFRNVLAMTRGKSTGEVYDRFLRSLTNAPGKRPLLPGIWGLRQRDASVRSTRAGRFGRRT